MLCAAVHTGRNADACGSAHCCWCTPHYDRPEGQILSLVAGTPCPCVALEDATEIRTLLTADPTFRVISKQLLMSGGPSGGALL